MAFIKWCMFAILCSAAAANIPRVNLTEFNWTKVFPADIAKQLLHLDQKAQEAILNDYVDKFLPEFNAFVMEQGIDPVTLPNVGGEFGWSIFTGEMALKNGQLHGISTMVRNADVTLWYDYPNVKLRLPIKLESLTFNYEYAIQFMNIGPDGYVDGSVEGCRWTVEVELDMTTLLAKYKEFDLDSLGNVSLEFSGGLFDWLINIFVSVAIPFVKPVIKLVVGGFATSAVSEIVGIYNGLLGDLLGPPAGF